jgi:hypothetical protein
LARAVRFARVNDISGNPEVLWHTLAYQMMCDNPDTLILAAVDGSKVYGHFIAKLLNYDGELIVMITQLEIDKKQRDNREETMRAGMAETIEWAKSLGATGVRCWAMNETLAKLFERFGLAPKDYVLMHLDIAD